MTHSLRRRTLLGGLGFLAATPAIAQGPAVEAKPGGGLVAPPGPAPLRRPAPFSLEERAWRYERAMALMRKHRLQALLVSTAEDDYEASDYLAGPIGGSFCPVVCVPAHGAPFAFAPPDVSALMPPVVLHGLEQAKLKPWIEKWRFGHDGIPQLVEDMQVGGLGQARIGGVNLVGHALGDYLSTALPDARLIDVTRPFIVARAVLSPESQAAVKATAAYVERAVQVLAEQARPGVSEAQLNMAVKREVVTAGGIVLDLAFGAYGGWGGRYTPPRLRDFTFIGRVYDAGWRQRGLPPRVLQAGDILTTEIFCWTPGVQVQAQVTLALGPTAAEAAAMEALHDAYRTGVAAATPGARLSDVAAAMAIAAPPEPLVRVLNPARAHTSADHGAALFDDIVLTPGMHIQITPNQRIDGKFIQVGAGLIVTAQDPIELNTAPTRVLQAKA